MRLKNNGFTMVELLAVMVLLGLITGISIPLVRNVQESNQKRKYTTFADAMIESAKIYNDAYSIDLFTGATGTKCVSLSKLKEKELISDIEIDNISCISDYSFVKIVKNNEKYTYTYYLACGKKSGGVVAEDDITIYYKNSVLDKPSNKKSKSDLGC